MRAGIYARISHDPYETTLGVQRQIEDCTQEAERRGWKVVDQFVDNDVSATRSKVRPEYERMMQAVKDRHIDALIVWDIDRLTRTPRELEDIIDLADTMNLSMANIGGEIDLSTPQGKMTARIKGSVARHESDQLSRRLKRAYQQRAIAGKPHSAAGFGFQRVERDGDVWDIPHPENAAIVNEAAHRYVAGESLRSICLDFMKRGIHGPRTDNWTTTTLRQIMQRPVNIGLRQHRGEIVGKANADPIMTEALYNQVMARLNDPERIKHAYGRTPNYLLTAIAVCGLCGGKMRMTRERVSGGKRFPDQYNCKVCFKVRRKREPVDELVTAVLVARLQDPKILAALTKDTTGELPRLRERVDELTARLDIAADNFADGLITGEQLRRINSKIMPELDGAKRRIGHLQGTNPVTQFIGVNAAERWQQAPLEIQRQAIQELMTVTIMPAGSGGRFDPEQIKIEWKV